MIKFTDQNAVKHAEDLLKSIMADSEDAYITGNYDERFWILPFCPLSKEICRTDCVCYKPPYIYTNIESQYSSTPYKVIRSSIIPGCCENAMFKEKEIYVNY
jgi:hypothetical protein